MDTSPLTLDEASDLVGFCTSRLCQLDDLERRPSAAIPRAVLTCGDADRLLSCMVALLVHAFPSIAGDDVRDLAESRYRPQN